MIDRHGCDAESRDGRRCQIRIPQCPPRNTPKKIKSRDFEKSYPLGQFVAKLRRFAEALETGEAFTIQIAGERLRVPKGAIVNIEDERGDGDEEFEFQIKWKA